MRFSTFQVPSSMGEDDDEAVIDLTVRQSLAADRQGFAGIFLAEHHATGYVPTGSDPVAMAAYLAPQLTQAWLGFAVAIVPSWHPVRLVERLNLLDQLTKGKLLVGLGSGVAAIEHAALGLKTDDMVGGMTDEVMDIALRLWAKKIDDPEVSFQGKYYNGLIMSRVVPSSYTRPHPRLARVGARPEAIATAAEAGWPLFVFGGDGKINLLRRLAQYRMELLAAGHDEETLAFAQRWTSHTVLSIGIGETEEEGYAHVMADLEAYQHHAVTLRPYEQRVFEAGVTSRPPFPRDVTNPAFVKNNTIWGTADQVEEKLREYETYGLGNLLIAFNYGAHSLERRQAGEDMQARFAEEIMPRFAQTDPPLQMLHNDLHEAIADCEDVGPAIAHPTQRTGA